MRHDPTTDPQAPSGWDPVPNPASIRRAVQTYGSRALGQVESETLVDALLDRFEAYVDVNGVPSPSFHELMSALAEIGWPKVRFGEPNE